jgi:hypothetical protein
VPGTLGHSVTGAYKYGDLALQVGRVSRIGTIKYGLESQVTQTRAGLRWREPATTVNYRIRPLVRESATKYHSHTCLTEISRGGEGIGRGS